MNNPDHATQVTWSLSARSSLESLQRCLRGSLVWSSVNFQGIVHVSLLRQSLEPSEVSHVRSGEWSWSAADSLVWKGHQVNKSPVMCQGRSPLLAYKVLICSGKCHLLEGCPG